ncbi:MAG: HPr family phosphocarrier protein [Planctomycetia bacterium]|nr:HPr family phosphocarrier protein [Planctomycetia bacterium]
MSEIRAVREVVLSNSQGLHLRLAQLIAARAGGFQSKIVLIRNNDQVDGKSIINLLGLGAAKGSRIVVQAEGPDADEAIEALVNLLEREVPDLERQEQEAAQRDTQRNDHPTPDEER